MIILGSLLAAFKVNGTCGYGSGKKTGLNPKFKLRNQIKLDTNGI